MAGNIVPSYEVAGDWFDVIENRDGIWLTLADGWAAEPGPSQALRSLSAPCEQVAATMAR